MQAESGRWISEHIFAHSVTSRPLFSELFDSGQIYTISFSFEVAPDLPESLFTELLLTLNASDELGLSKISGQAFIYTQELWQIGIYPSLESSQADILRRAQILFDFIHQFESERHSLPYFGSLPDFVSRSEFIHQQAADADVSLLDTSLLLNGEHQSYASDAKDYLFLYYLTPSINAMNVNKRYQSCIALYYWFARTCTSQILKGYAMSLAAEIAFKTGAMDQVDEFTKSAVEMVNSSQVDLQESSMKDRLLTMKAFAKFARSKFNFDRGFFMEVEEDVQECIAISEGVPCMEECRSAFYLLSGISKHLSILQSHSSQSEVQPTKESRHAIKLSKHSSHPSSPFFSVIRQNYPLFIDLSLHLRVDEAIMHFTPRDFKNTQFDVDLEFLINRTALMQPRRIPEGLLSQSIQDFLNVISSSLLFLMIKIMITTRFDEYAEMILNAFVILGQAHCVMIAEAHAYLGLIYQYKNDLSSAMHNFQRAIDILRSNAASDQHFSRVFVLCSRTMSRLLVEIEDFSAAESLLSQAETFIRDDPESHSFVSLLLDKARIATLFGDSSTAEALSRTALHVVQQVQSGFQTHKSKLISQAYTALFLSLPANRQPSEGQYYLSLAIKHYEESVMVRPELPPPPKHSQIAYLYVLSARAHRLSDANASRNWLSDAKLILQAAPCGRYLSLLHKEAAELELTEGNLYEAIQECKAGLAIILKVRPTHSDATELFEIMAVCYARVRGCEAQVAHCYKRLQERLKRS